MKKSKILPLMLLTLGLSANSIFAASMIENEVYTAPLSKSINFKKITENYARTANNIYILEADLNDKNNKLDVMLNTNGISNRLSIKNTAPTIPGLVGAINADFFLMTKNSSSIGTLVKDKKIMSSPAEAYNKFANIIITDDGAVSFEYITDGVVVDNETKGSSQKIQIMNKQLSTAFMGNAILSSDFSYATPGKNSKNPKRVEVIVSPDGYVTEVRENSPSAPIPYGGYAIISYNTTGSDLKTIYSVGDKVTLTMDILKARPNIKTIIGGGSVLIKDGQKTWITNTIPGKAQRSALAITNDNKLLMVANDGRQALTAGFDEKDMQNYLYNLGVKDAIMLDGGGSSALYVDGKTQNYQPSERAVINALVLKNENQTGVIEKINVTPMDDIIYVGDEVPVIASAQATSGAKDTNYNTANMNLSSQGFQSTVKGSSIVPTTAGKGQIIASVGGVIGAADVNVLESHAHDSKNVKGAMPKINIYPDTQDQSSLITDILKFKIIANSQAGDINILIGNGDLTFSNKLNGENLIANTGTPLKTLDKTIVVSLNSAKPLYDNEVQIQNLDKALNSSAQNIIIAMQSGAKVGLLEQDVFDKKLESYAQTKNIYLIYKSDKYDAYKRGNVSYISIIDFKNNAHQNLSNVKYLQMFEDANGGLTYDYKAVVE